MKTTIVPLLAVALTAFPCAAQTASELLQKGIYTQETVGDLDSAIQLYRQAVSAAGTQRDLAAQAQYRLAQAYLRKGDTGNASLEMDRLAHEYPDQRDLVAKMAATPSLSFALARAGGPPTGKLYDESKLVTVQGNVTQLMWLNPTAWMHVTDSSGAEWNISTASPNQLLKQNWTRNSLVPGAAVTITAYPATDGTKTAAATTVILQSDGTKLFDRALLQAPSTPAAADAAREKK